MSSNPFTIGFIPLDLAISAASIAKPSAFPVCVPYKIFTVGVSASVESEIEDTFSEAINLADSSPALKPAIHDF